MNTKNKNIIKMNGMTVERLDGACVRPGDWRIRGNQSSDQVEVWEGDSESEEIGVTELAKEGVKFLSARNEKRLVAQMKAGDVSARDRLFEAFRPLAIRVASQCFNRWRAGLEREDLVAWGYLGLLEGLARFDPNRGVRVSTCVTRYITKAVYRANANFGRLIRIPVNQTEKLTAYYDFARRYEAEQGVLPSIEVAAAAIGVRCDRLEHLVLISGSVKSLHAELGESAVEHGGTWEDYLSDSAAGASEQLMDRELMEDLSNALEAMDPRDALIVKKRFNLDGEGYCTLDAIANTLDLTKERVRQLEKRALERLRAAVA
jgi:RNA polymerase primary sigma factor